MPGRRYQQRDNAALKIAKAAEPKLRKAFRGSLVHLRDRVDVKKLAAIVRRGARRSAIEAAVDFVHIKEVWKGAFDEVAKVFEAGAELGAKEITAAFKKAGRAPHYGKHPHFGRWRRYSRSPIVVRKAVGDEYAFDRFDAATQGQLRDYQDQLIAELEDQARGAIEAAVLAGVRNADTPEEIAAAIRDSISLTAQQATAVGNFRQLLEAGDAAALDRALRDTSYDNIIEALVDGDTVSDKVLDDMVDAYSENYLDYRAETIARTEATRAANVGLHDAYSQAIERGVFPSDAVKRFWLLSLDEKTCELCISIHDLNEAGVRVDEAFASDDGEIEDPPVHPSCRCGVQYETDIDMLPVDEEEEATA